MADDLHGLLDALELGRVHLAGMSMGGMIAQCYALRHPERLHSLTSISSTTGSREVPSGKTRVLWTALGPRPRSRRGAIRHEIRVLHAIGSPAHPVPIAELQRLAELLLEARDLRVATASYERGYNPDGIARQLAAILASGSRRRALPELQVPTLVLHGEADPMIPMAGGEATAQAIPGARLITIPGWGHDLPPAVWPTLVEAMAAHAAAHGEGRA